MRHRYAASLHDITARHCCGIAVSLPHFIATLHYHGREDRHASRSVRDIPFTEPTNQTFPRSLTGFLSRSPRIRRSSIPCTGFPSRNPRIRRSPIPCTGFLSWNRESDFSRFRARNPCHGVRESAVPAFPDKPPPPQTIEIATFPEPTSERRPRRSCHGIENKGLRPSRGKKNAHGIREPGPSLFRAQDSRHGMQEPVFFVIP